jgi:SAM-dependent methyltransferase
MGIKRMLRAGLRRIRKTLGESCHADSVNLAGDRELEWSYVAGHLPEGNGTILDFGCGSAPLGLVAALKGYQVLAIDRNPVVWSVSTVNLRFQQADILSTSFPKHPFDAIINCSTVEHVGLAGRYGSSSDADGDLTAMQRLRGLLKITGQMIMTVPVGQDMVCQPLHRIYGQQRLPQLLEGYHVHEAQFWTKRLNNGNAWVQVDKAEALAVKGGRAFYGLGLFVLGSA